MLPVGATSTASHESSMLAFQYPPDWPQQVLSAQYWELGAHSFHGGAEIVASGPRVSATPMQTPPEHSCPLAQATPQHGSFFRHAPNSPHSPSAPHVRDWDPVH